MLSIDLIAWLSTQNLAETKRGFKNKLRDQKMGIKPEAIIFRTKYFLLWTSYYFHHVIIEKYD